MKKLAIIGSGIAGLTCAYYLNDRFDITVYEEAGYIGGHTHTVSVQKGEERADIDTGFIVFNDRTYPNFIHLMDTLQVAYQPTEMSFSVRNDAINLEYNGNNLSTLFAQRSNIFRLAFYKMLQDIVRFNRAVKFGSNGSKTIGEYLHSNNYSVLFKENYLLPMISAIWSMGLDSCLDFPLDFFTRFFQNHGLLDIINRPQWYTIKGGSSSYIAPLTANFSHRIRCNSPVVNVQRTTSGVTVNTTDSHDTYDEVILACHGDQAYSLLANPTHDEIHVLKNFTCTQNSVVLHTDTSILPKRKGAWASWNYNMVDAGKEMTTLTYNMNILQCLNLTHTYLVSLNQPIKDEFILGEFSYSHPVYSLDALSSQQEWQTISGTENIHYCGAYWFNGFHEDGVRSGLRVVKMLEKSL